MGGDFDPQSLPDWALQDGRLTPPWQEGLHARDDEEYQRGAELVAGCMTPLKQLPQNGWTLLSFTSRRHKRARRQSKHPRGIRRNIVFDNRQFPSRPGFKVIVAGFTLPFGPDMILPVVQLVPTALTTKRVKRRHNHACQVTPRSSHLFSPVPFPLLSFPTLFVPPVSHDESQREGSSRSFYPWEGAPDTRHSTVWGQYWGFSPINWPAPLSKRSGVCAHPNPLQICRSFKPCNAKC